MRTRYQTITLKPIFFFSYQVTLKQNEKQKWYKKDMNQNTSMRLLFAFPWQSIYFQTTECTQFLMEKKIKFNESSITHKKKLKLCNYHTRMNRNVCICIWHRRFLAFLFFFIVICISSEKHTSVFSSVLFIFFLFIYRTCMHT